MLDKHTKRLTRNTKMIAVVCLILAVASFAFYTNKQMSSLNDAKAASATAAASLAKLHSQLTVAEAGGITAISQLSSKADTAKQVLPKGPLPSSLTNTVYQQAQSAGLQVTSFGKQAVATGPNKCLSYQPFTLGVTGSQSSLINWVTAVQTFTPGSGLPLLTLSSVSIVTAPGSPGNYTLTATLKAWSTSTTAPAADSAPSQNTATASC
jgi:Tfp pilus assembly protein PilO